MEEEIKENSSDSSNSKDVHAEKENIDNEKKDENIIDDTSSENAEENEIVSLKKRIEELEKESADMKNKYMYAMAEAENIRKRTAKEKIEGIKRANKELLLSLLNFMDNFERALKAGVTDDGIELIHKQFIDFLHDNGVSEIELKAGDEFDPNVHEALTMMEVPDIDKEQVVEVYIKGYKLNDELLRTAKVVVGKPPATPKE